jgi:hypothetical protein
MAAHGAPPFAGEASQCDSWAACNAVQASGGLFVQALKKNEFKLLPFRSHDSARAEHAVVGGGSG